MYFDARYLAWPLLDQLCAQQLLSALVDVSPAALLPNSKGDDEHEHSPTVDPIKDPIALPDGAQAAQAGQFTEERFALLLRVVGELLRTLEDLSANGLIRHEIG